MSRELKADCCVVGGGPAGMMAGYLFARAGLDTVVLEKHGDFLRDFRGDTVHPSTLELFYELGLLERFLQRPHQRMETLAARFGGRRLEVADFSDIPARCHFIAFVPQWEFLDFLADEAARYPDFRLLMRTDCTGLLEEEGRIAGVRAQAPDGAVEIRARLVVGADGRHSTVRSLAGLRMRDLGAPIDVLWFALPRKENSIDDCLVHADAGRLVVTIDRGDYWQCAYVIAKGGFDAVRANGLESFRKSVAATVPHLEGAVAALRDWDEVKLLTVKVERLERWTRPGLLCIGDAAHAMSPVGGVGINLAVQDAVAAANLLCGPLLEGGPVPEKMLDRVRRRRLWPARITQFLQVQAQDRILAPLIGGQRRTARAPLPLRLIARSAWLRRATARAIGLGARPEHVASPDAGRGGTARRA